MSTWVCIQSSVHYDSYFLQYSILENPHFKSISHSMFTINQQFHPTLISDGVKSENRGDHFTDWVWPILHLPYLNISYIMRKVCWHTVMHKPQPSISAVEYYWVLCKNSVSFICKKVEYSSPVTLIIKKTGC